MKVLRGQEARLESGNGFYRNSESFLSVLPSLKDPRPKSVKIFDNLGKTYKSANIHKIQGMSSEDKKPAWDRAKVSIGAASVTFKNLRLQACKV